MVFSVMISTPFGDSLLCPVEVSVSSGYGVDYHPQNLRYSRICSGDRMDFFPVDDDEIQLLEKIPAASFDAAYGLDARMRISSM